VLNDRPPRSFGEVFTVAPDDDLMHLPGDAATFNESMYFNLVHPASGIAAWCRLGNRPNEGYAEVTVCVYRPDGSIAFHHARPPIAGNDAFNAGGLSIDVIEPLQQLRVRYDGPATVFADPLALRHPCTAFAGAPVVACRLDLSCAAAAPVYGGRPRPGRIDPVEGFADATTLQLVSWRGEIAVGAQTWTVDGSRGLRDHSWGPRLWQAPDHYRWLTANLGRDGFMALVFAPGSQPARRTGFVVIDGGAWVLDDVELAVTESDGVPRVVDATLSWGGGQLSVRGTIGVVVPLRHRRAGDTTFISEGVTRWECADGRSGHGFIEFLDKRPAPADQIRA
jgi:hypothetical protein